MSIFRFFSSFIGGIFAAGNTIDGGYNALLQGWSNGPPVRGQKGLGTGYPTLLYNQQTVEQYLAVLDMLTEMYMFSVAGISTKFISEAVLASMSKEISVAVNLNKNDKKLEKVIDREVKKYLDRINIRKILQNVINDVVYYGSYSFWVDQYNLDLEYLYDPHAVINVLGKNQKAIGYLLNTHSGMVFLPREDANIFRIGNDDLILYSKIYTLDEDEIKNQLENSSERAKKFIAHYANSPLKEIDEKSFKRDYAFSAALPLFYYSRMRLREYILKEIVIALVTLRDLLFPTVYTINYDYPAVNYTVQTLVDQIEDILNSYVDVAGLIGVKGDLSRILNMLTYSVRVLPDFRGHISNLNPLDTSKMTEKIDKYKGDLGELLEQILNEIAVPSEAFVGRSTYWESLRQSDRFIAKISNICSAIENSISYFLESITPKLIKQRMIKESGFLKIKIFDLTIAEIARMQNAIETIQSYVTASFETLSSAIEGVKNTENTNPEYTAQFIKNTLYYIFPNIEQIVDFKTLIKEAKENAASEEEEEDFGFKFETPKEGEEEEAEESVEAEATQEESEE